MIIGELYNWIICLFYSNKDNLVYKPSTLKSSTYNVVLFLHEDNVI